MAPIEPVGWSSKTGRQVRVVGRLPDAAVANAHEKTLAAMDAGYGPVRPAR